MKDEFGNFTGADPPPPPAWRSWLRVIGRWLRDTLEDFWNFIEFIMPGLILIAIVGILGGIVITKLNKPTATITLDRSEWACTNLVREAAFVTQQGIPINHSTCTQWSKQP